jgi:hypothetical protein
MEILKHAEDYERDLCWQGWPYKITMTLPYLWHLEFNAAKSSRVFLNEALVQHLSIMGPIHTFSVAGENLPLQPDGVGRLVG